ncbi:hypothetical protein ACQU0X_25775 [Pseudovibrio ascidiaceicola]|uniref:hypothetical protein n=1 Tax=Pseudovibrio ascidiaceicola TaxID=285279 RepID=UPI003D364495
MKDNYAKNPLFDELIGEHWVLLKVEGNNQVYEFPVSLNEMINQLGLFHRQLHPHSLRNHIEQYFDYGNKFVALKTLNSRYIVVNLEAIKSISSESDAAYCFDRIHPSWFYEMLLHGDFPEFSKETAVSGLSDIEIENLSDKEFEAYYINKFFYETFERHKRGSDVNPNIDPEYFRLIALRYTDGSNSTCVFDPEGIADFWAHYRVCPKTCIAPRYVEVSSFDGACLQHANFSKIDVVDLPLLALDKAIKSLSAETLDNSGLSCREVSDVLGYVKENGHTFSPPHRPELTKWLELNSE